MNNFLKLFFGLLFLSHDMVEDGFVYDIMAFQPQLIHDKMYELQAKKKN